MVAGGANAKTHYDTTWRMSEQARGPEGSGNGGAPRWRVDFGPLGIGVLDPANRLVSSRSSCRGIRSSGHSAHPRPRPGARAIARMADVAADPRVGRRTPTVSDGRHGGWPLHERANRCKDHRPAILAIALGRGLLFFPTEMTYTRVETKSAAAPPCAAADACCRSPSGKAGRFRSL